LLDLKAHESAKTILSQLNLGAGATTQRRFTAISGMVKFPSTGGIEFKDSSLRHWYVSTSGKDRGIVEGPIDLNQPFTGLDAIISGYDFIFAIDANCRPIGGNSVAVAVLIQCIVRRHEDGIAITGEPAWALEYHNCTEKHEQFAWIEMLGQLKLSAPTVGNARIVVVTDHAAGELRSFNNRSAKLAGRVTLPANVTLVHASDRTSDSVPNKMVRHADKIGSELLRRIEAGEDGGEPLSTAREGAPVSHYRHWTAFLRRPPREGAR
jgi:hypothetical protein